MADDNLGAWDAERRALEATRPTGRGSDADAPNPIRFGRAVMQLIARRERQADAEYDRHAAFVLVPREWQRPGGTTRRPLMHNGQQPLTGQIHFVNLVPNGYSRAYTGDEGDLFDALVSAGVQKFPTLVYSPKQGGSTLSWFPAGIDADDQVELWNVAEDLPSAKRIAEVIESAYSGELITPDQTKKSLHVWEDAAKGWAHEEAEARVQHMIRLTLLGAFRRCNIRGEQSGKDGRTDLEIVENLGGAHNQVVNHAILELKVLREMGSTGNKYTDSQIATHMRDGLEQAHHYGTSRNFREWMLCCFDMRAENLGEAKVMAPLGADAKRLKVDLRYWFLYRSSDHWRKCAIAKALSA
jgi:hypothetical protein